MPIINKYDEDYDFKYVHEIKDSSGDVSAIHRWYFYLGDNTVVYTKVIPNRRSEKTTTEQMPMIECKKFGVRVWDFDKNCWLPYNDEIQKAYADHVAERELLDKK